MNLTEAATKALEVLDLYRERHLVPAYFLTALADLRKALNSQTDSSSAPAERTRVEGEQWRQGMKDAAKEVCDACDNEERYGPARKIEGSTRWWHGDDNIPCEAGGIWHVLAERTTNAAAAPADNDAESLELLRTSAVLCISGDGQPRVSLLFKELKDAQAVHEWLVRLVHGKSTTTKGDR